MSIKPPSDLILEPTYDDSTPIKSEMLNYSSTHLNGATIDMHMPYALFQYCISCILEIANHHAFTLRILKAKVGSAWIYAFDTVRCGPKSSEPFIYRPKQAVRLRLDVVSCGTKENNHDAKGPKGADPARTGPGERVPSASVSCHFTDRG